jgi:hypothetical protein
VNRSVARRRVTANRLNNAGGVVTRTANRKGGAKLELHPVLVYSFQSHSAICRLSFVLDVVRPLGALLGKACAPVAWGQCHCRSPARNPGPRLGRRAKLELQARFDGWGAMSCSRKLLAEAWASCIARATRA